MKIKQDFVTNSSSTGFIVFIPDFEKLTTAIIENKDKIEFCSDENPPSNERIKEVIDKLSNSDELYGDDDNGYRGEVQNAIIEILNDNKYNLGHIIKVIDISGEGCNFIINISPESVKPILEHLDWVTKLKFGIEEKMK